MPKKRKRSVYEYTRADAEFITTATREFVLCYPDEFDDVLEQLSEWMKHPESEPGLTPLEHIVRQFEKAATRVLQEHEDSQSMIEPIEVLSAKQVLYSSETLRRMIQLAEAERAAVEMMKLIFSAISADIHNVLMTGIRAKHGQTKGGRASKLKEGITLAIQDILQQKPNITRGQLWLHFKRTCNNEKGQKGLNVGNHIISYEDERLWQEIEGEYQSISKSTFYQYVTRVKKSMSK